MDSYEQSCNDFANHSSPWQEHCEDSQASQADINQEMYGSEADAMDYQAECEDIDDYEASDEFVGAPHPCHFTTNWRS